MEKDCQRARAKFIAKSTEVREALRFAQPLHVLRAIEVMCMDAYGSMLWSLESDKAEQFFKSWNTCVKLVYNVPLNTFTYLVEGYLASNLHSKLQGTIIQECSTLHILYPIGLPVNSQFWIFQKLARSW